MKDARETHARKTDEGERIAPLEPDLKSVIMRFLLGVRNYCLDSDLNMSALDLSFSASRTVQMFEASCGYTFLWRGEWRRETVAARFSSRLKCLSLSSQMMRLGLILFLHQPLCHQQPRGHQWFCYFLYPVFFSPKEKELNKESILSPNGFQPRTQSISKLIAAPKDDL